MDRVGLLEADFSLPFFFGGVSERRLVQGERDADLLAERRFFTGDREALREAERELERASRLRGGVREPLRERSRERSREERLPGFRGSNRTSIFFPFISYPSKSRTARFASRSLMNSTRASPGLRV